jgi:uncharacterized protein Yka (UPF0111/DUF47 family)
MMTWVAKLLPKEEQFFPLFEQHAEKLVEGASVLRGLLHSGPRQAASDCEKLSRIEKDAKAGARQTLDAVRLSFVTPFNRVDIKGLITEIDRCLRDMRRTARASTLLATDAFEPAIQKIGDIIVECAEQVRRAMPLLPDIDRRANQIAEICGRITGEREQSDELFDQALKLLAKQGGNDSAELFKINAIYDRLEDVMDGLESIASLIHDVVIDQV